MHVNLDHVDATDWRSEHVHLFAFGAYASTFVLAFGRLEDALEDAASTLKEVAPGCFTEPEYAPEVVARFPRGGVDLDERENARLDRLMEEAEADLTYSESGWLPSHEWTVVGSGMSPEEIREWAANKT